MARVIPVNEVLRRFSSISSIVNYLAAHGFVFLEAVRGYLGRLGRVDSGLERKEKTRGILEYKRYEPGYYRAWFDVKRLGDVEDAEAYIESKEVRSKEVRYRVVSHLERLEYLEFLGVGENVDVVV